jgi:hypothetical protein
MISETWIYVHICQSLRGFRDAFFDVSVINSCTDSYVRRASKGQLEGIEIRYEAKMGKYPELGGYLNHWWWRLQESWHRYSFDYLKLLAEISLQNRL